MDVDTQNILFNVIDTYVQTVTPQNLGGYFCKTHKFSKLYFKIDSLFRLSIKIV